MDLPPCLNHRDPDTHKGHYGHALLVAGSHGMMGAALLAAKACLRTGVGLLSAHVPSSAVDIMQTALPEAMLSIDSCPTHLSALPYPLDRYAALAIGPGLGTHPDTAQALHTLLVHCTVPLVVDADALNIVAQHHWHHQLPHGTIVTPHQGEYHRLFADADPAAMARHLGITIVVKSHRTRICLPDGTVTLNTTGNAGMATAGSGDVLTGIILALLAQGLPAPQAATTAVFIHGKSGDMATQKQSQCSLIASDIVENIKYATL